jgi:hypothetical protein
MGPGEATKKSGDAEVDARETQHSGEVGTRSLLWADGTKDKSKKQARPRAKFFKHTFAAQRVSKAASPDRPSQRLCLA